jgi:hypothetical protein
MGLDQNAYKVKSTYAPTTKTQTVRTTEICYWRKHNALQGWMEELWCEKTGKTPIELNYQDLEITSEDLDKLEATINNNKLPSTQGFFYGFDTSQDESRKEYDLDFVSKARTAIKEGYKIIYSCWW